MSVVAAVDHVDATFNVVFDGGNVPAVALVIGAALVVVLKVGVDVVEVLGKDVIVVPFVVEPEYF